MGVFFFFFFFKNLAEVAIIPKDGLARFGYILDMKVEKRKTRILLLILGYLLELIIKIWRFGLFFYYFYFEIWRIWSFFLSMKNPLYRLKSYFSGQNLTELLNIYKYKINIKF
jgi:hypothetical protein